jgi:hypothetical protein
MRPCTLLGVALPAFAAPAGAVRLCDRSVFYDVTPWIWISKGLPAFWATPLYGVCFARIEGKQDADGAVPKSIEVLRRAFGLYAETQLATKLPATYIPATCSIRSEPN